MEQRRQLAGKKLAIEMLVCLLERAHHPERGTVPFRFLSLTPVLWSGARLPWNPQRIEQRIRRCHRYGQEHDVTVINFLASDNEVQKLTFEILSRRLDLFGKVLDASDVVLHEPSTDAPEALAGALGSAFESRLRRIYERARAVTEIEAELRRLREEMDGQRGHFEQTWARTAGLIESRFDQKVKQVFRNLQTDLPKSSP